MTPRSANTLVLVSGGLMLAYAALDARKSGSPPEQTYKRIYSIFLATVALGLAADLAPTLVGPFAVLVIVAAWAKHKGALGGIITGAPTAKPASVDVNTIGGAK